MEKFQGFKRRLDVKLAEAVKKGNADKERKYLRKLWFMKGLMEQRLDFNALHEVYELH